MTWNMLPVSELIEGAVDQHVESNRFSEVWKLVTGLCLGSRRTVISIIVSTGRLNILFGARKGSVLTSAKSWGRGCVSS